MSQTAIIYSRFSSAEQSKGYSLERQQTLGAAFAAEKGWLIETTITDEARSAFHGANRLEGSALHQFELEARNGLHRGKVLVVENIDRLSRQGAKAAAQLIWGLNEHGVDVATYHDGTTYRADDSGDLLDVFKLIMGAQQSHQESVNKSKRTAATARKRDGRIEAGEMDVPIANMPNWIRMVDGKRVLIEDRTSVLNLIYDLYIDGVGIHRIVTTLHERGIPSWTPPEQLRGNNGWFYSHIYRLLTKRAVLGEYVNGAGRTLNPHFFPQAITAEKWNRAQAALSMRKGNQTNVKVFGNRNLLSQMIVCEKCSGGAHFGHTTDTVQKYKKVSGEVVNYRRKTYRKLRCDRARRNHNCDNGTILNYDVVEATILQEMLPQLARKPDANGQAVKLREQIADLIRLQDAEQVKLNHLIDALAGGGSKAIVQRVSSLEVEVERLSMEIASAQKSLAIETAKPAGDDDVALVESLRAELTSEDDDVRIYARGRVNMSLRRLIKRIVLTETGLFRVEPDDQSWWLFDKDGTLLEGAYTLGAVTKAA